MNTYPSPVRRIITGLCWLGAGLSFVPGALLKEPNLDHAAAALTTIAAGPAAFLASTFLALLYAILLVPALVGVADLPRDRGARLTNIGANVALIGNLGHAGYAAFALVVRNIALADNRSPMLALMERINGDVALIVVPPLLASYALGLLLAVMGLYRARLVGVWPVVLIAAAVTLDFGSFGELGYVAKVLLGSTALAWVGVALLAGSRRARQAATAMKHAAAGTSALVRPG